MGFSSPDNLATRSRASTGSRQQPNQVAGFNRVYNFVSLELGRDSCMRRLDHLQHQQTPVLRGSWSCPDDPGRINFGFDRYSRVQCYLGTEGNVDRRNIKTKVDTPVSSGAWTSLPRQRRALF